MTEDQIQLGSDPIANTIESGCKSAINGVDIPKYVVSTETMKSPNTHGIVINTETGAISRWYLLEKSEIGADTSFCGMNLDVGRLVVPPIGYINKAGTPSHDERLECVNAVADHLMYSWE